MRVSEARRQLDGNETNAADANSGALAQGDVVELDRDLDAGIALALRSNFPTSLFALREAGHLEAGETLLVHAGAGGVGQCRGATGAADGRARHRHRARGAAKLQACRDAGADAAVDYSAAGPFEQARVALAALESRAQHRQGLAARVNQLSNCRAIMLRWISDAPS